MRALLVVAIAIAAGACDRNAATPLAPQRPFAPRLAYAAFDRPRALDPRAERGEAVREVLPLDVVERLSHGGDRQGLGDAALLAGELNRAAAELARAGSSPAVENDLAVVSLLRGDAVDALERLDAALARGGASEPARWNRALALAALDLPLSAARVFEGLAATGTVEWRPEAAERARVLRSAWEARRARADRGITVGKALLAGGPLPPPELVRTLPSLMRHYLYHAARAAPSVERLRQLVPLARALDDGKDGVLTRWLAAIVDEAPRARATLGPRYRDAVLNFGKTARADEDRLLADARRQGARDLLLGALVLFGRRDEASLAELRALAARTHDPWWDAAQLGLHAQARAARGDFDGALELLTRALAETGGASLAYRRADLENLAAQFEKERHHTSDARRFALASIADARDLGTDPRFLETRTVFLVGEIAHLRSDFSLMHAYLDEGLLRVPDLCAPRRYAYLMFGVERVLKLDLDGAARQLVELPRCENEYPLLAADLVTSVARSGRSAAQTATVAADLAGARASFTAGQRLLADVIQARLVIDADRPRALRMLEGAMSLSRRARDDADAQKARTFAFQLVAIDAGRRGDYDSAIDTLAREAGAAAGERCALGVAVEDARMVVAARDDAGGARGIFIAERREPAIDAATLVPAELSRTLAGCVRVAVYAEPPVHGRPMLLPPTIAWSYRLGRTPAGPGTAEPRRLIVSDVMAPARLGLPTLSPWMEGAAATLATTHLRDRDATPERTLAELVDATEVEIHAHGLIDLDRSDAWMLALSPGAGGRFALTADEIEQATLRGRPFVVLAACDAGRAAPYLHEPWSLPTAFLDAGARAVVAAVGAIPDDGAGEFFAALQERVRRGEAPEVALRDERLRRARSITDAHAWLHRLVVFE